MGDARQRGHLLTGLDIRHVQDLIHVQVIVLKLAEQSLGVVPSNDTNAAATTAQTLCLSSRRVRGGGGLSLFVRAGVIFTGLLWLAEPLALDFTIRVRVSGLWLVFERGDPLHRTKLAVDFRNPCGFDSPAAVGGNATAPVDGWSCKTSRCNERSVELVLNQPR